MRRRGERGYAMVAAVGALALLATASLVLVDAAQCQTAMALAERGQAQARAAAQAGLVLALEGLLVRDRAGRWSIDGRTRLATFGGMQLRITVEDERGKISLSQLDEDMAARLAALAGLSGERARIAADSLLDYVDDDEEPRAFGAEREYYAARGRSMRNGLLQSIDELGQVRGFDGAALERLRPFVTVRYAGGGFDASHARPEAIGVMLPGGANSPEAIARARELAGQRVAVELGDAFDLAGRPLTITVLATGEGGVRYEARWLVELTGNEAAPYVIRAAY